MARDNLTPSTRAVLETLGAQVRLARASLGLSAEQLGRRAGVDRRTVAALERGAPSVSVGNAFEIAIAAGINLFGVDNPDALRGLAAGYRQAAALLPARVMRPAGGDNDF